MQRREPISVDLIQIALFLNQFHDDLQLKAFVSDRMNQRPVEHQVNKGEIGLFGPVVDQFVAAELIDETKDRVEFVLNQIVLHQQRFQEAQILVGNDGFGRFEASETTFDHVFGSQVGLGQMRADRHGSTSIRRKLVVKELVAVRAHLVRPLKAHLDSSFF